MDSERHKPKKSRTPLKAIREMCKECMGGGEPVELIRECASLDCALYDFRFGRNPFRKPASEKQKAAARANMARLQESQR